MLLTRQAPGPRPRRRLLLLAAVAALLDARGAPAWAQAEKTPAEPEELRAVVARRVRAWTGVETRIKELSYEVLASRFVVRGVELGPRGAPLLRLPSLVVELALLASQNTVRRVEAQGLQATVNAAAVERALRSRAHRALIVNAARLTRGRLTLIAADGGRVELEGLEVGVQNLTLPAGGDNEAWQAKGSFTMSAEALVLGGVRIERLAARGKLEGSKLVFTRLEAKGLGGGVSLAGSVTVGAARLGPVELKGTAELQPAGGPHLAGKITLRGKTIAALTCEGRLAGAGTLAVQHGGETGAPALRLRLRLGRRELRGTLADWQLR